MAKGLRNKLLRRNKREKRVRYGKKELVRLLNTVQNNQDSVTVRDAAEVVRSMGSVKIKKLSENDMEVSEAPKENKADSSAASSLRAVIKEHGTVPKWIHPRKTAKAKKMKKRVKRDKRSQQNFKSQPKK